MKRAVLFFGLLSAALSLRAEYETLPIATDAAMGECIRFESRGWADEALRGEGGRLAADVVWTNGEFLVAHDVYVPNGVTLTIGAGATVKFCAGTRIKVEDGGSLVLAGEAGREVVLTGAADDTVFKGIVLQSDAANYRDNGYVISSGFAFNRFATVSLGDASAFVAGGQALVPVSVSGTRASTFSLDWVAETNGVAFATGTLGWNNVNEGRKNIVVPFGAEFASISTFTVRVVRMTCCQASKGVSVVTLSEYRTADIQADAAMGNFIAFESRDWTTNVVGEVLEGGRLAADAVWSNEHVVASSVYVPNGVTLTLTADTVVRFCEGTMIKIEDGGALKIIGADGHDVILRGYEDGTQFAGVVKMTNGVFSDNSFVQFIGCGFSALARVAPHDATSFRSSGLALLPVTVSGSRATAFSIDWVAETNEVEYTRGTLKWGGVDEGTKNISFNYGAELDGQTNVTVRVAINRACTAVPDVCQLKISDFQTLDVSAAEAMGGFIAFESREWTTNMVGKAVEGGRLAADAVWSNEHVVASSVYIPNGVTLTITADALVRLCEGVMIKIEDGGRLNVVGAPGHDAVIRNFDANTVSKGIVKMGSGTYTDNMYVQTPDFRYANYPNVTLHEATVGRDAGKVFVPITLGGATRDQSFNVDWATEKGDAGTVTWARSGDGTKWIEIPVSAESVGGTETYGIRLTAARGVNVSVGAAKVTIHEYEHPATNVVSVTDGTDASNEFAVHGGIKTQPIFLNETEKLRYSGRWQDRLPPGEVVTRISVESDNGIRRLGEFPGSEEGTVELRLGAFNTGLYTLTHETVSTQTDEVVAKLTKTFSVIDADDVVMHGGTLTQNEVWKAGKTHVVYEPVYVPALYTLFIEPGAVVKFMTGTGIDISQGGALFANAIVFTHINDDTVGGDTLSDGFTLPPPMDGYFLTGNFTFGDDAELRNLTQQAELTGTINSVKMLSRGSTYRVSGTLTIANGAKLTIPPGTVLKMGMGASIVVNSGGELYAQGTRAAPIVITSINDDSVSGKTEGSNSNPQPGDWTKIMVNGTGFFDFTKILYSSRNSATGAINMNMRSGTTTFINGEISHCAYDAVGVESGHFYMTNSIISDALLAFRHSAKDPIVNCVIYDCGRLTQGGGQRFVNCVFSRISETWEAFGFPGSAYNNCCFWNEGGSVLAGQDAMSVCGKNGNLWGDPLFIDPGNGDFRIREGSPCVDAADSAAAPELDVFGQPRVTVIEQGTNTVQGQLADIGICELMPRNVTSDIDLVPEAVRTETEATVGQLLFVKWTVRNDGGVEVDGSWRDTLSLVSKDGREVTLGEKLTTSRIASGGSVFCSGYFTVPAIDEGDWHLKVNVNSHRDIFEGALGSNNALMSESVTSISLPSVSVGDGEVDGVIAAGVTKVVKLAFDEDEKNRMVHLDLPAGVTVRYGFGFMPNGTRNSGTLVSTGGDLLFKVPDGASEVYITLDSDKTAEYEMSFGNEKMAILSVSPNTLPSSGTTTLTIAGAGFGETNEVRLSTVTSSYRVQSIAKDVSGNLIATVDCAKLTADTTYDVTVTSGENEATLSSVVAVTKAEGKGHFWARLVVPDTVREGRKVSCAIEYGNSGNANLQAPILQVSMEGTGTLAYLSGLTDLKMLQFVAAGENNSAGVLRPGATHVIYFEMLAGSSNQILLHSSVDGNYAPEPWINAMDYITDISAAATRVGLRGKDATDFAVVLELARTMKNGVPSSSIFGIMTDDFGNPLCGAVVALTLIGDTNKLAVSQSDNFGFYSFDGLSADTYQVKADLPFDFSKTIILEQDSDVRVDMSVPYGSRFMRVEVCGASETVSLSLTSRDGSPAPVVFDRGHNVYNVYGLHQDTVYALSACADRRQACAWVAASDDSPSLRIELSDIHTISGRIESFRMAEVRKGALCVRLSGCGVDRFVTPSENGEFEFSGIPEGTYRIDVCETGWGYDGGGMISVAQDISDIVLVPFPANSTLAGRLDCSTGTSDLTVELVAGTGCSMQTVTTDAGMFSFSRVPTGPVLLFAYRGDDCVWWTNVIHETSEAIDLGSISIGTVPNKTGRLVAAKGVLRSSVEWDWFDRWFESEARMKSYELYDEAQSFWRQHRPAEPPSEYRCAYNMSVYALDQWDRQDFGDKLNKFGNLSLQCSRMKTTAYAFKSIHDGAQLFGDFYAIICGDAYKGSKVAIAGFKVADVGSSIALTAAEVKILEGLKEDVSSIDKILSGISWSSKYADLFESSRKLARALNKTRGRISNLSHGITDKIKFVSNVNLILSLVSDVVELWNTALKLGESYADYKIAAEKMRNEYPKFKAEFEEYKATVRDSWGRYHECDTKQPLWIPPLDKREPDMRRSSDPNEMAGPIGKGDPETERFVEPGEWMTYTVYFENKSDATAAAQEVFVENQLSEYLDWSTFEMGEIAFNNQIDLGLSGKRSGTSEATMKGTNFLVRTELTLDEGSGKAAWYLRIVDPTTPTGWPDDVVAGFLPPNDETFRGEGHLTYRVKVREDAPVGARIDAAATIVFDYNDPIPTDPAWWNTVGAPGAAFDASEKAVEEGGALRLAVSGGSLDNASKLKVHLAYQTAAAADLDLARGTIDGVAPKGGLKFPLELAWAKGDLEPRTLVIPMKTDKAVEDDETLVLQLAAAQGVSIAEPAACVVTIRDANAAADYAAKQAKEVVKTKKGVVTNAVKVACVARDGSGAACGYTTGQGQYSTGGKATLKATARPGWEFAGWGEVTEGVTNIVGDKTSLNVTVTNDAEIVAVFGRIPYVAGLCDPADGGKVTGGGYCPAGRKVTLKATPNRNFAFEGWYTNGVRVAGTPSLVIDRGAKPAADTKTQTVLTGVGGTTTFHARFRGDPEVFVYQVAEDGAEAPGKVTGAGRYAPGQKVSLKAAANKGYVFRGWYAGTFADPLAAEPFSPSA
ncbi:MAG: hypothetical protein ACI4RA_06490, partial [Kiritimatiellia bacterium]